MKITTKLIEKYYAGECSEAERKAVEYWMNELPSNNGATEKRIADAWTMVSQHIAKKQPTTRTLHHKSIFYQIAAAIILLLVLSAGGYYFWKIEDHHASWATEVGEYIYYKVPAGHQANITLNDGTIVELNAESTLRYPKHFTSTERLVFLEGEGLFSVAKDAKKPFRIHTKYTQTEVLGTTFNLRAYSDDIETKLTVLTGKVAFKGHQDTTTRILKANQYAYWSSEKLSDVSTTDPNPAVAWKSGQLIFDNQEMAQVVRTLERHYNVQITMTDDKLLTNRVTASYLESDIEQILISLSFSMGFGYEKNGQKITIKNQLDE